MFDPWNAVHVEPDVRQLAEDWLTSPRLDWTAADDLLVRWFHTAPDKALATICAVAQLAEGGTLDLLAAGPLEDWLCHHGETQLETIKALAHEHDLFRQLLCGVGQNSMPTVLYQKIRAIGVGRL